MKLASMIPFPAEAPVVSIARQSSSYGIFVPSQTGKASCNGIHRLLEIPPLGYLSIRIAGDRGNGRMIVKMRDKGKNRKPLQKGRNLSIEAIQAVQALKRVNKNTCGEELQLQILEKVLDSRFRRLLKLDMMAVLRELLRQNECFLALKVFEEIQKEYWYTPQASLYAEMFSVLGSTGLLEEVELLFMDFNSQKGIEPDTEAFYVLLKILMTLSLTEQVMQCFYLMKSLGCDLDKTTFKMLINYLESKGETDLSAIVRQEAEKCYGMYLNFLEEEEEMTNCN